MLTLVPIKTYYENHKHKSNHQHHNNNFTLVSECEWGYVWHAFMWSPTQRLTRKLLCVVSKDQKKKLIFFLKFIYVISSYTHACLTSSESGFVYLCDKWNDVLTIQLLWKTDPHLRGVNYTLHLPNNSRIQAFLKCSLSPISQLRGGEPKEKVRWNEKISKQQEKGSKLVCYTDTTNKQTKT